MAKLLAPLAPFYADQLWKDLGGNDTDKECSVHLTRFPEVDNTLIDKDLEARMEMAQQITSMTLALRRKVSIRVRQPLQQIIIPAVDDKQRAHIEAVKDLIMHEVNIKELNFVEGSGILVKKVKCNFRAMGKKYGKLMKDIAAAMSALDQHQINSLEKNGKIELDINSHNIVVEESDVEIISEDIPGWLVSNEGNLTVALEVELTEELRNEGMAREIINRIQNLRKESGFEITDRINIVISPNEQTDVAISAFEEMIKGQVLGDNIFIADNDGVEVEFDEFNLYISLTKQ